MTQTTAVESALFNPSRLLLLDSSKIPNHIAIIPDGNRRWAKKQQQTKAVGHRHGADGILDIVEAAKKLGVKHITIYVFSTENWNRSKEEIDTLMVLLESYLYGQKDTMIEKGVHFNTIGDTSLFSNNILKAIAVVKEATQSCHDITLTLALNYGGRNEICRAMQRIVKENIPPEEITEELLATYLDTKGFDDPDLLIRTSGEMRISNFLLWQSSYSEIYFSEVMWPEFTADHLLEAVLSFQERDRRLGGE